MGGFGLCFYRDRQNIWLQKDLTCVNLKKWIKVCVDKYGASSICSKIYMFLSNKKSYVLTPLPSVSHVLIITPLNTCVEYRNKTVYDIKFFEIPNK